MYSLKNKKILLTGGDGFLGGFVLRGLLKKGIERSNIFIPPSCDYDLRKRESCLKVTKNKDIVIHLAGRTGGIAFSKDNPGMLFYDNAAMALNIIDAAYKNKVEKFVGIGSICEYPKFTPVPFRERDLWNGYPEETNAPYGLAKKMMLVQSQAYNKQYGFRTIHLLLINIYGPADNFDPNTAHVIPALIKKIVEAERDKRDYIEVWGTGKATREFLYVEDAAEGIILAAEKYNNSDPINLGSGKEISIKDLVELICHLVGFKGKIHWDSSKPDGQPRRILDVSLAKREFNFAAKTSLKEGLKRTIDWYYKTLQT